MIMSVLYHDCRLAIELGELACDESDDTMIEIIRIKK
jgi:hypothetical protein